MKAAETLSDGLVKLEQIVRPLIWDGDFAHTSLGTFYHVNHATGVPGFVVLERHEGAMITKSAWATIDEGKAAAQAHYLETMTGALNLDPILSEIKRMREVIEAASAFMPLAQVAFLWQTKGAQGDEVERYRDGYWRLKAALSQEPDKDDLLALCEEKGLCATVPTEVYLAYEERAKAIAERDKRETPTAIKNAILALVLEARLSGMIDGRSSQDPTNDRK